MSVAELKWCADNLPAGCFGPLVRGEARPMNGLGNGANAWMKQPAVCGGTDFAHIAAKVGSGDPLWGLARDNQTVADTIATAGSDEPTFGWPHATNDDVERLAAHCEGLAAREVEAVGDALGLSVSHTEDLFRILGVEEPASPEEEAEAAIEEFCEDECRDDWHEQSAAFVRKVAVRFTKIIDTHGPWIGDRQRLDILLDSLEMPCQLVVEHFPSRLFGVAWAEAIGQVVADALADDIEARTPADGWEAAAPDLVAEMVAVVATVLCNGIDAPQVHNTVRQSLGSELYHTHFVALFETPVAPAEQGETSATTSQETEPMPDGSAMTADPAETTEHLSTAAPAPSTRTAEAPADFMAGVEPGAVPAIVLERKDLVEALAPVAKVVPSKSTLPIVECVLLEANNGRVRLTGDDLTVRITRTITGQVDTAGAVALPCHALVQMVRAMPDGAQVQISTGKDGERMRIRAGRTSFALPRRDPDTFPALKVDGDLSAFTLAGAQVESILLRPRHAIDKTGRIAGGVHLRDSATHIVGESGSAMGLHRAQVAVAAAYERLPAGGVVVPDVTVNLLSAMLDGGEVQMHASARLVVFKGGFGELMSKLVDQQFPDIDGHIANVTGDGSESLGSFTAERLAFIGSLNRVMLAKGLDEKTSAVTATAVDGFVELRCGRDANDASQGSDALEVCLDGDLTPFVVNGPYLVAALEAIPGDTVNVTHVKAPPQFNTQSGVPLRMLELASPTTDSHRVMVALMIG